MPKLFTPRNHSNTTELKEALLAGPGKQTLNNIFAYARALKVVQTRSAGQVNLLMN